MLKLQLFAKKIGKNYCAIKIIPIFASSEVDKRTGAVPGTLKQSDMAKYIITHKCGHKEEIQLFGKNEDRERKIAYLESLDCEDCRKAAANAESLAAKESRGLADLNGSEKQIAWANTIREKAYKCLDALKSFATNDAAKKMIDNWENRMDNATDAKFWIDNRFDLPTDNHESMARTNILKFNTIFA